MESSFIELRCKEVVNILDGRKLGHIIDLVFDLGSARVLGFIVPGEKTGWNVFKNSSHLFLMVVLLELGKMLFLSNCLLKVFRQIHIY